MAGAKEAVEVAGAVGEGNGVGLGEILRRGEAGADEASAVSICQRAVLDRQDGGRGRSQPGQFSSDDTSLATPQHFGSERATLQLDVHGGRIFLKRSSSAQRRWERTKNPAGSGVPGDGAGGNRTGSAAAAPIHCVGATSYNVAETSCYYGP